MAKKRGFSSSSKSRRDAVVITNRRLPTLPYVSVPPTDVSSLLREIEDRRNFHPAGPQRDARSFALSSHSLSASPSKRRDVPRGVSFAVPDEVLICVRRRQRKEVLHALDKTGRAGQKPPRRNYYSDIHC